MTPTTFAAAVDLIAAYTTRRNERIALLETALFGSPALNLIDYEGSANTFCVRLVLQLLQYDTQNPGETTLVHVLEHLQSSIGLGRQYDQFDALIKQARQSTLNDLIRSESLYITYAPQDTVFARQLVRDLSEQGVAVLDRSLGLSQLHPDQDSWTDIFRGVVLPRIRAAIFLVSPNARTSRPLRDELTLLQQQGKTTLGLWIDGAAWDGTVPTQFESIPYIDARGLAAYEPALKELSKKLNLALVPPLEPELTPDYQPDASPYRGLRTFERSDWEIFFGRGDLIKTLVEALRPSGDTRFLAITGPSGSGKSSVIKAGLLPKLEQGALEGSVDWTYVPPFTPGDDPFEHLSAALAQLLPAESIESIKQDLQANPQRLASYAQRLTGKENSRLIVYIDQFEELFTLTADETARQRFIDLILYAATVKRGNVHILLSIRVDFLGQVWHYDPLMTLVKAHECRVETINQIEDLRDVILKPARLKHLQVEPDLVSELLADVRGQAGTLPLLQFTLDELFRNREGVTLTLAAYERLGKLSGALDRHADNVYLSLSAEDQTLARLLFLRLIKPGTTEDETTRVRIRRSDLQFTDAAKTARIQQIVDQFIEARLIVASGERDETIEIAHEALVRGWNTLQGWQKTQRDQFQQQQDIQLKLEQYAQRRNEAHPFDDLLYKGQQLNDIEIWAVEHANVEEGEFIRLSREAQNRERAEEEARLKLLAEAEDRAARSLEAEAQAQQEAARRRTEADQQGKRARRLLLITAAAGIALLVLIALAAVSLNNLNVSEQKSANLAGQIVNSNGTLVGLSNQVEVAQTAVRDADYRGQALIASSQAQVTFNQGQYSNALKMALDAVAIPNAPASAYRILAGIAYSPLIPRHQFQDSDSGNVADAVFLDGGQKILSIEDAYTIILWGTDNKPQRWSVPLNDGFLNSLALTHDEKTALIGDSTGELVIWDMASSTPRKIIPAAESRINRIAVTPDGQAVLALDNGTLQLWNIETGSLIRTFTGHTSAVLDVAVMPDGQQMISASADKTLKVWNLSSSDAVQTLNEHTDYVTSVVVSSDGTRAISGSLDHTIIVWNTADWTQVGTLSGHTAGIRALALSSNGRLLMSGDSDGVLKVWDWSHGYELSSVNTSGSVWRLIPHPNGRMALSIEAIPSLVEDLPQREVVLRGMLSGNVTGVFTTSGPAVWDGKTILTASCGDPCSKSTLWQIDPSGTVKQIDEIEDGFVTELLFSPSDSRLWVATNSGRVFAWNISAGKIDLELPKQDSVLGAFALSGDHLLVASSDSTIGIWNTTTGALERSLQEADHSGGVSSIAVSPDGTRVASGDTDCGSPNLCTGDYNVWANDQNTPISHWEGSFAAVDAVAFLPDGKRLLSASGDGTLQIWDTTNGTLLKTLTGHSAAVTALAISPDGKTALSGSCSDSCKYGEIIEWDLASGEALRTFTGHGDYMTSLQYSPDGQSFVSTSADNSLYIWRLDSDSALLDWIKQNYDPIS